MPPAAPRTATLEACTPSIRCWESLLCSSYLARRSGEGPLLEEVERAAGSEHDDDGGSMDGDD